jgi:hypothetical protein
MLLAGGDLPFVRFRGQSGHWLPHRADYLVRF